MDKIYYYWYYHTLKMDSSEILHRYRCFNIEYNYGSKLSDPTACGITSIAVLDKIKYHFGGQVRQKNISKAKKLIIKNSNTVMRISICSYNYSNGFFPGHAIVIIPLGSKKYMLLQSYIDHYSLMDWIKNNKLVYKKEEIIDLIDFFTMFESEKKFTINMAKKWENYTKISVSNMVNHQIQNNNTSCIYLKNSSSVPLVRPKIHTVYGIINCIIGMYLWNKMTKK